MAHCLRSIAFAPAARRRALAAIIAVVTGIIAAPPLLAQYGTANGEWRYYGGDAGSTRYAPLEQISKENFKDLRVVWRWKTENFGPAPEFNYEATPLMVNGVLYTTAGLRRNVVAIDAANGETLWMWRYDEGSRAQNSTRPNSGRGLAYWTDGQTERIVYISPGYRLIALDAKTGRPAPEFGQNGMVDLYGGLDRPVRDGQLGASSPPLIVKDVIVVGAAPEPGAAPKAKENVAGHIRGYDVRSGKQLWIFHTVPVAGEFGVETWEQESWRYTGNTAVWAPMTADPDLGYVYLPVESPTNDFYGGHRLGDNLFANSLVCLDARTGRRVWHFQVTHHDVWDYDLPAAPILLDVMHGGRTVKAVAQITKQGFVFVFDRVTGEPLWPIEERPVPQSDVPGERTSPTQPFPTKPAPFDRQGFSEDDLIDFTPELKSEAVKVASSYKYGPLYTPGIVTGTDGKIATLHTYAGNWQGGAADPDTGMLYVGSITEYMQVGLRKPDAKRSNMNYDAGRYMYASRNTVKQEGCGAIGPLGLPLFKPPWGRITAIDLNTGESAWVATTGATPACVKQHPLLKDVDIPETGTLERPGVIVTKTLVIAGQGGGIRNPSGPLSGGPMLRAYDKKTGALVGEFRMPANQTGIPMTYMVNGRQIIVVPIGGRNHPGELVALAVE